MKNYLLLSMAVVFSCSSIARADYASTVLEDKPFAYYRFEDEDGTDELADSSGNNNVGWEINNVGFGRSGVAGSSAGEFFGDSSIVTELDFDPSVDGLTNWTIETWFYTTGIEEIEDPDDPGEFIEVVRDQQVYISQKDGGGLGRSNLLISANRQPGSYIGGGTTNAVDPNENEFVEVERWYHFVAAANGDDDELLFFVNGEPSELNPQFPGNNGVESADGEWVIGSHKNQGAQFFEGLLDEIAFYDRVLSEERIRAHYDAASEAPGLPGDFDGDGLLTSADIDRLSTAVRDGIVDSQFDLNQDGAVNGDDRTVWVKDLKNTYVGDANLDGVFGSGDLVEVFTTGQYEDGKTANSGWATGDWNGDAEFDSADFVAAFSDGGYELPPREPNVAAVPEPSAFVLAAFAILGLLRPIRRR
ncbi:MAG: hypothetical protein P8N76_05770 [Pirellulaceae bacterium]|nr:hypothetical protein [Pirellulaceae bacterium]